MGEPTFMGLARTASVKQPIAQNWRKTHPLLLKYTGGFSLVSRNVEHAPSDSSEAVYFKRYPIDHCKIYSNRIFCSACVVIAVYCNSRSFLVLWVCPGGRFRVGLRQVAVKLVEN